MFSRNYRSPAFTAVWGISTSVKNLKKQWKWDQIKWVSHNVQRFPTNQDKLHGMILNHSWITLSAMSLFSCFHISLNVRVHSAELEAILGVLVTSNTSESEKAMASHSSTLAWKIPWAEEPGGLQCMGSLRVGHDWATSLPLFTFMHWRRKWQPTPVFLPGESQGWGAWWAAISGVAQLDTTEVTQQQQQQHYCLKSRKFISLVIFKKLNEAWNF